MRGMITKGADFDTEGLRDIKASEYETPLSRLQKNAVFDKVAEQEHQIPDTNLYISGFGRDMNGNSLVYINTPNQRRRSIQTNSQGLFQTYNAGRTGMAWFDTADPDAVAKVEKEVLDYVQQFGTPAIKNNLKMDKGAKKQAGVPEEHQLRILKDTVKNPAKGFLGGPTAEEAEKILKDKFKYTDEQIKKLKASKKTATIYDGFGYRVTIEAKAGDYNESYTPITSMLKSLDIRYREDRRYTVNPDRQMMDILVNKEDIDVIAELNKQSKETGITFTYNDAISEAVHPKIIYVEDEALKQDKPVTASKKSANKTVKQLVDEMRSSKSEYVTYGEGDLGKPIKREDAIADIETMDDEMIGEGTWYECDSEGNVLD